MSDPSDPSWAGAFTENYFSFVRRGWWHLHDAENGSLKGIMPVIEPFDGGDNE